MPNRIAIYVFWEKNGILRNHHLWYLEGLREIAQEVLLVANGLLTQESRKQLEKAGITWLVRENRGLDFAAWKAGLEKLGRAHIQNCDELILCNCSCYGPVFPFSDAFETMSKRSCDFWGINRQPERTDGAWERSHIQSYFYVFRRRALEASVFWQWWDDLVEASSYHEEIHTHEVKFSGYLERHGLTSDTLMDFKKYQKLAPKGNAVNICSHVQLLEDHSPLIKRKHIFGSDENSWTCLFFTEKYTNYPIKYICEDMVCCIESPILKQIRYFLLKFLFFGKRKIYYQTKYNKLYLLKKWKREGVQTPISGYIPRLFHLK